MSESDQDISIVGEHIHILRKKFGKLAFTSYTPELFESLKQTTWTPTKDGYMISKKFGSLHRHVMELKYGQDVINEAYANDFIIEHFNNDGFDCSYTNLEIIPRKLNSAKGLTYDEEREKNRFRFALNFSKDERTDEFQISIGFNKPYNVIKENEIIPVAAVYLRYGKDYKTTLFDAQSILNDLVEKDRLEFSNLRVSKILIEQAIKRFITYEEAKNGFAMIDGKLYFVQGSEHTILDQLAHKKDLHED